MTELVPPVLRPVDFTVFEAVGALVVVLDRDRRVVWWNEPCAEWTGRSSAEVLNRPLADVLLLPAEIEAVTNELSGLVSTGVPGRSVHRWVDRAGDARDITWAIAPTRGPDGLVQYLVATGIAEPPAASAPNDGRKDGDLELRTDMALLAEIVGPGELDQTLTLASHLVVQRLADACFIELLSPDGRLRRARAMTRTGSPLSDQRVDGSLLERSLSELAAACVASKRAALRTVADADGHPAESLIGAPLMVGAEVLGAQVLLRTPPSPSFRPEDLPLVADLASSAGLAIRNAQRCDSGLQAIRELREANEHMVAAVIRAQEESEAGAEREQELRESAELRELFLGILGHDLRNPVSGIQLATAALARGGRLSPEDAQVAERILRSTRRIQLMILQLLDLVQARRGGGFHLEPRPTDLRRLCPSVVEEFENPPRLDLHGDVTGTWDPDRLEQALSNLTRNAIEHAAPGTRAVVEAYDEGAQVVIEVRNQGDPLPAGELAQLFQPFQRRRRSKGGNLGLGLYIADQIARLHGGTLEGRSAGGITTFRMRLPRTLPEPETILSQ